MPDSRRGCPSRVRDVCRPAGTTRRSCRPPRRRPRGSRRPGARGECRSRSRASHSEPPPLPLRYSRARKSGPPGTPHGRPSRHTLEPVFTAFRSLVVVLTALRASGVIRRIRRIWADGQKWCASRPTLEAAAVLRRTNHQEWHRRHATAFARFPRRRPPRVTARMGSPAQERFRRRLRALFRSSLATIPTAGRRPKHLRRVALTLSGASIRQECRSTGGRLKGRSRRTPDGATAGFRRSSSTDGCGVRPALLGRRHGASWVGEKDGRTLAIEVKRYAADRRTKVGKTGPGR